MTLNVRPNWFHVKSKYQKIPKFPHCVNSKDNQLPTTTFLTFLAEQQPPQQTKQNGSSSNAAAHKGKFFSEVKISILISTTFEFSRQK